VEGTMRVIGWTVMSLALLAFAGACQEYNIGEQPPPFIGPNPPELDNPAVQDRIVQIPIPSVDVMWIIDNSGSMLDEQTALKQNFPAFMNYFLGSGLDYHIGVVTTDMDKPAQTGKLQPSASGALYITTEDEDPMQMFEEMASVGIRGSSWERGREAAYMGMELLKNSDNEGFLRDDLGSGVHMTIVSDEPDLSRQEYISKEEFVAWGNALRPEDELVTFNSICNPPNYGYYSGQDYIDLTNGIGGILHDVHQDNWVDVLEQLGVQAAGLRREYFLSHRPVVDTIEVKVVTPDGDTIPFDPNEWEYSASRNSITFDDYLPDPMSEVFIDYTVLSSLVQVTDEG
jgi:hypothetical protein